MPNYRLLAFGVKDLDTGDEIPPDDANTEYRMYRRWMAAGNTPLPMTPEDWRPEALERLADMRDRLIEVTTTLQADYQADGDTVNAKICRTVKAQLKTLQDDPAIVGANTRAAFRTALRARLNAIATPAPLDVQNALKAAMAAT